MIDYVELSRNRFWDKLPYVHIAKDCIVIDAPHDIEITHQAQHGIYIYAGEDGHYDDDEAELMIIRLKLALDIRRYLIRIIQKETG